MNTLKVNDLCNNIIADILDTINKRGYKVIYKRSNRRLVSIYFYDKDAYLRASKYVERVK